MKSKLVGWYYRTQNYIDIAWGEFSWFTDSLIELMAVVYLLEKMGVILDGTWIVITLGSAYLGCFLMGVVWKKIGMYDRSSYVDTHIDPVDKINYRASQLIVEKFGEDGELEKLKRTDL